MLVVVRAPGDLVLTEDSRFKAVVPDCGRFAGLVPGALSFAEESDTFSLSLSVSELGFGSSPAEGGAGAGVSARVSVGGVDSSTAAIVYVECG